MRYIKIVSPERGDIHNQYGFIEFDYSRWYGTSRSEVQTYSARILTSETEIIAVVSDGEFIKVSKKEFQVAEIMSV